MLTFVSFFLCATDLILNTAHGMPQEGVNSLVQWARALGASKPSWEQVAPSEC